MCPCVWYLFFGPLHLKIPAPKNQQWRISFGDSDVFSFGIFGLNVAAEKPREPEKPQALKPPAFHISQRVRHTGSATDSALKVRAECFEDKGFVDVESN